MVTCTSYSQLFYRTFFAIISLDCLAQLTEMQAGKEKAEAIKKKLNALS